MPNKKDNILNFKNYEKKEKVPFVVYADIKCLLEPIISTYTQIQLLIKSMSLEVLHNINNVILLILSVQFIFIEENIVFNGLSISQKLWLKE